MPFEAIDLPHSAIGRYREDVSLRFQTLAGALAELFPAPLPAANLSVVEVLKGRLVVQLPNLPTKK